jgi:hypothetical protein
MSLHESRSSKRSKPSGDAEGALFTIARTTDQLETTEVDEDITRLFRSYITDPSQPQLTKESLLQLEQSLPGYRLAHRNLHHWFFYIKSII